MLPLFSSVLQDICLRSCSNSEIAAFSPQENYLSVLVTYDSFFGGMITSFSLKTALFCFPALLGRNGCYL